jgi:hypothetical protein
LRVHGKLKNVSQVITTGAVDASLDTPNQNAYDELEELTLRIDVYPDDCRNFDEHWTKKLEGKSPPDYPITKASVGVLELLDGE